MWLTVLSGHSAVHDFRIVLHGIWHLSHVSPPTIGLVMLFMTKQGVAKLDFWVRDRDFVSLSLIGETRPRLFSSESQYQDETELFFPESQCRNRTETFFSGSLNVETRPRLFQSLNIATRQRLLYKT